VPALTAPHDTRTNGAKAHRRQNKITSRAAAPEGIIPRPRGGIVFRLSENILHFDKVFIYIRTAV